MQSYVEWFDGRSFFTETESAECPRSIEAALEIVPAYAFGFRFYELPNKIDVPDFGHDYTVTVTPKRLNVSGIHYIDGMIYSQYQVATYMPDETILLSNMKSNDWKYIVRTRTGNFQPFDNLKDMVI